MMQLDRRLLHRLGNWPAQVWLVMVAVCCGVGVGLTVGDTSRRPLVPVVQAMTAMTDENFAVCTATLAGGLGGGTEGFFLLDFLTGDLSGGVLNPATSTFGVSYRHNVLADLGFQPGQAKDPRFLLIAGQADLRRSRTPLAPSVLYVTDCSSGATVAYGIPYNAQKSGGSIGPLPLVPLDVAQPRGGGPQQ
jgi:hypothetical protein